MQRSNSDNHENKLGVPAPTMETERDKQEYINGTHLDMKMGH